MIGIDMNPEPVDKSNDTPKPDAKQRIRDAAVELFAHQSYAAVGTRDIAKKAGVNLAMINYYYGGKMGLLKALIMEYTTLYYELLERGVDPSQPVERYVSILIRNLVVFYRENLMLALAVERTAEVENEELQGLRIKLAGAHKPMVDNYFNDLGLDPAHRPVMAVFRGFLTKMVLMHFQERFAWEEQLKRRPKLREIEEREFGKSDDRYDDAFYEQYAQVLERFYLQGACAVAATLRKPDAAPPPACGG
ncbi:MAG: TetR/AcrR family transcriptional regulator [bacterium]